MGVNCLRVRWPNKPIKVAPRLHFCPVAAQRRNRCAAVQWRNELPENTYDNRDLEKAFVELARPMYQSKVPPSLSGTVRLSSLTNASSPTRRCAFLTKWRQRAG